MKKILGLATLALFVASVASDTTTTTSSTGNAASNNISASSNTATGSMPTTDVKASATATCQKKGLAGALLDECVKNEVAKNTATTTKTAPNATGTTSTTNP